MQFTAWSVHTSISVKRSGVSNGTNYLTWRRGRQIACFSMGRLLRTRKMVEHDFENVSQVCGYIVANRSHMKKTLLQTTKDQEAPRTNEAV